PHSHSRTRLPLSLGPATDGCRVDESTRSQPLQIGGEGTWPFLVQRRRGNGGARRACLSGSHQSRLLCGRNPHKPRVAGHQREGHRVDHHESGTRWTGERRSRNDAGRLCETEQPCAGRTGLAHTTTDQQHHYTETDQRLQCREPSGSRDAATSRSCPLRSNRSSTVAARRSGLLETGIGATVACRQHTTTPDASAMTTSRSFTLLCTVGVFCFISYNMVRMPVLSLFAESLGASPERIGLIVSVSTLTGVFLKLPSGALSDIYGRRFLLQIGVVAFGLPPFLYPWVTDLDVLTSLRFFHGLATAIFAPSALATVADLYRERRGAALGPFIGGYLIHASGFSSAFVTAGIFGCIAIAIFYSLRLTQSPPRVQEKGMAPLMAEMWKGFRVVAKNRKVLITSSTDAAKMIANGALMAFLPLYGVSAGLNPGEVGLLFTVQALTSLVSKPIMGRVSDSIGRQPLIVIGLVFCAATFVC